MLELTLWLVLLEQRLQLRLDGRRDLISGTDLARAVALGRKAHRKTCRCGLAFPGELGVLPGLEDAVTPMHHGPEVLVDGDALLRLRGGRRPTRGSEQHADYGVSSHPGPHSATSKQQ